jgi:hypothetical protein
MNIENDFKAMPYAYWFSKIKERTNQRIITLDLLKDVFMREILCDDGKGGNKRGIPKRFMWAIINDMKNVNFEPKSAVPFVPLMKKINNASWSNYELSTSQSYKKILQSFPF